MSKLLTQAEISYAVGNITMATDNDGALTSLMDLAQHIDALTAELKSTESRLHEVAVGCANAEYELKRRDALAGEPVGFVVIDNIERRYGGYFSKTSVINAVSEDDINEFEISEITVYAAPPSPAVPDEMTIENSHIPGVNRSVIEGWNLCRSAMLANKEQK